MTDNTLGVLVFAFLVTVGVTLVFLFGGCPDVHDRLRGAEVACEHDDMAG